MLNALTLLLVFQLLGEVIGRVLALPVPGPVIGMALLFALLVARGGAGESLRATTGTLLQHLSLLFVPAGTGILLHIDRVAAEWLPLAIALLASTLIGISVTALVLQSLIRRQRGGADGPR